MSNSEKSLTTVNTRLSLLDNSLSNENNLDLIRQSAKAKLVFMYQKLTAQQLINQNKAAKLLDNNSKLNDSLANKFSGMRHEYEFDYENELGSWLSEKSNQSAFEFNQNDESNLKFASLSGRSSPVKPADEWISRWSYLADNPVINEGIGAKSQPKTSKEILKEIARLTNGTTPKNK